MTPRKSSRNYFLHVRVSVRITELISEWLSENDGVSI